MKVNKKIISKLSKCYSIAPLTYNEKNYFLVAAEKKDPCLLFDLDGKLIDTVWTEPGGVMTMVQVPGSNGQFLATHQFYSPNDSKEAKIVVVTPQKNGKWEVKTLVDLPFVHRFDLLQHNRSTYLIACSLKSEHNHKDDWSSPGKVYVAKLPENLSSFNEKNQLELRVLKEGMLKNHGYYRVIKDGIPTAVISCEQGVFQFIPPQKEEEEWVIHQLLDTPVSDAVLVDLDEDGEMELCTLSPFHGSDITIYKKINAKYQEVFSYEEPAEFLHAIYGGNLCGKPSLVVGHRQGKRNLITIRYDQVEQKYKSEILDSDCGSANVICYEKEGKDIIISANREIDEIALYTVED